MKKKEIKSKRKKDCGEANEDEIMKQRTLNGNRNNKVKDKKEELKYDSYLLPKARI